MKGSVVESALSIIRGRFRRFRRYFWPKTNTVYHLGFHGDAHILELVTELALCAEVFVETGANVGSTSRWVGSNFPHLDLFTCEPDPVAYSEASRTLSTFPNIHVSLGSSPQFLYELYEQEPQLSSKRTLFFLDAHGYGYKWPLREELSYITDVHSDGCIIVDDFKVPGHSQFGFESYAGQDCDLDYVLTSLRPGAYSLLLPCYEENTSEFHPLVGHCVLIFGSWDLPMAIELEPNYVQVDLDIREAIIRQP